MVVDFSCGRASGAAEEAPVRRLRVGGHADRGGYRDSLRGVLAARDDGAFDAGKADEGPAAGWKSDVGSTRMRLKGKTALIAGGASGVEGRLMGIGGAAVRRFSREGAQVVIADIKDEVGERTAAEIRAEEGEALYVHLDVTDEDDWIAAVAAAVGRFGKLDVLVDAAGTSIRHKVEETPVEDLRPGDGRTRKRERSSARSTRSRVCERPGAGRSSSSRRCTASSGRLRPRTRPPRGL